MGNSQAPDWKAVFSKSFSNLDELLGFCEIDPKAVPTNSGSEFPLKVTRYFASLIEKGNIRDPLLLQVLPDGRETQLVDGYIKDAVGDHLSMPIPGLIHKYHGRVLLTLTGACPIHCRYCFRRHFPYASNNTDCSANSEVMKYLSCHEDIGEVILSGGDPLMFSDRRLSDLITNLNRISHIGVLRIHSRLLSVLPERVTDAFVDMLQQFNGQVVLVTHINHPNEISGFNRSVFDLLSRQGYRLFNQCVLLKGVNDCPQTLTNLSNSLFKSHIIPYYLHRLDKVQGAAHFNVSLEESSKIYQQLQSQLPGYLLPAFVEEIPGKASKTPVLQQLLQAGSA